MGRDPGAPVTAEFLPSRRRVREFDPSTEESPCGIDDFKLDLRSTSQSDWNQSLADVFSTDFISKSNGKYSDDNLPKIEAHFLQHVDYLHGRFLHFKNTPEALTAKAQCKSRKERKARVSRQPSSKF